MKACISQRNGWSCSLDEHRMNTPHVAMDSKRNICAVWLTGGPAYRVVPDELDTGERRTA